MNENPQFVAKYLLPHLNSFLGLNFNEFCCNIFAKILIMDICM